MSYQSDDRMDGIPILPDRIIVTWRQKWERILIQLMFHITVRHPIHIHRDHEKCSDHTHSCCFSKFQEIRAGDSRWSDGAIGDEIIDGCEHGTVDNS